MPFKSCTCQIASCLAFSKLPRLIETVNLRADGAHLAESLHDAIETSEKAIA